MPTKEAREIWKGIVKLPWRVDVIWIWKYVLPCSDPSSQYYWKLVDGENI